MPSPNSSPAESSNRGAQSTLIPRETRPVLFLSDIHEPKKSAYSDQNLSRLQPIFGSAATPAPVGQTHSTFRHAKCMVVQQSAIQIGKNHQLWLHSPPPLCTLRGSDPRYISWHQMYRGSDPVLETDSKTRPIHDQRHLQS